VKAILTGTMQGMVRAEYAMLAKAVPPSDDEVRTWLDDLLSKQDTYRDATLAILAHPVANGAPMDVTVSPKGRRGVSQAMERLLTSLNIRCRKDVFQTIAKGSATLTGRDRESWNRLLIWASSQTELTEIERAFFYVAKGIAATARDLPPLPPLAVALLTFPRVAQLVDRMLASPSGGAYEQFIFAALFHAVIEEAGVERQRVETKTLSAADSSAGTAADVQQWDGGVVREAYEVSAGSWEPKLRQAAQVLMHYQLQRAHILAKAQRVSGEDIQGALRDAHLSENSDISVLDVRHEIRSLLHRLTRSGRRAALIKLYEHLVYRQPRDELVQRFVSLLGELHLTAM
jgi:hypothetical protein